MSGRYRTLGKTGLEVFELGFGGWAIGGNRSGWSYGPTDDRSSLRAVQTALDLGCNFFDTADWYGHGHSEELLGRALRARRSDVVISTKVGFDFYHGGSEFNFHPAYLRFALHQSLRRLATDYVDLYQLHNPPPEVLFDPDVIEALARLREQGCVRSIGVSAASIDDGLEAVRAGWPETIQAPYNLIAPEAEAVLFPAASAAGMGMIVREPLANGMLSGKYQPSSRFSPDDIRSHWPPETLWRIGQQVELLRPYVRPDETMAQLALRFVLESPYVSVVLAGCKTPEQARENFATHSPSIHRAVPLYG